MITMSANCGNLFGALAKAQTKIGSAKFDAVNPHFKSRYATLSSVHDACKAALSEAGISVSQHCSSADGRTVSVSTLLGEKSGEWMQSTLTLPLDKASAQGMGSAITYGRRYALAAMVGVVADEDDDGNLAETFKPEQKSYTPASPVANPVKTYAPPLEIKQTGGPGNYIFPSGKYKGRKVQDLSTQEMGEYLKYWSNSTTPPKGWVIDACKAVDAFMHGTPPDVYPEGAKEMKEFIDEIPF